MNSALPRLGTFCPEREPSSSPPNDSGAIGGDDEGVAFTSAFELRPWGGRRRSRHERLLYAAHGTEEQYGLPLMSHYLGGQAEQAGLMVGSVASDEGGQGAESPPKAPAIRRDCSRQAERSTGRCGVPPLEGVAAHEVAARGRLSPSREPENY